MSEQAYNPKRIGELNGPWAVLLKLTLVLIPVSITAALTIGLWLITAHNATHRDLQERLGRIDSTLAGFEQWKQIGPRFTSSDAQALELRVKADSGVQVQALEARLNMKLNSQFDQLSGKIDTLTIKINELYVAMARGVNAK